jgi:hypothetical protein
MTAAVFAKPRDATLGSLALKNYFTLAQRLSKRHA